MTDLLLEATDGVLDLSIAGGDLALDEGFGTALLASLFTDAQAGPEDELPDLGTDRRGWWAEAVLPGEGDLPWGSRLWLLGRAKITTATLGDAEVYAREALAWLLEGGVADDVEVAAARLDGTSVYLTVRLVRGEARNRAELWAEVERLDVELGPTRLSVLAIP